MVNKIVPKSLSKWPLILILVINIVAVIVGILAALLLDHEPKYFMDEGEPLTLLSFAQIILTSVFCGLIFYHRRKASILNNKSNLSAAFWLLLCIGFLFLGCDEIFSIHEGLDRTLHYQFDLEKTDLSDRLDDLILGLYLGIFFLMIYLGRKELKLYQEVLPVFKYGILLTVAMIFFDSLSHTNDVITDKSINEWVNALEDGLKLIAVGLLLSTSYYCFQIAKRIPVTHTNKLNLIEVSNNSKEG